MASVSGATSSLGNTSLKGFGGMASGIDRDAVIEQMTAGTNGKITKEKKAMTSLSWKQEAYQSVSSKMLKLQEDFFSFASGANLKDASFFAKNQITAKGDANVTKYVSAAGSSDMVDYLSVLGVKQLAASATRLSDKKGDTSSIVTNMTDDLTNPVYSTSKLKGTQLRFAVYNAADSSFQAMTAFTFPPSYKEEVINEDGTKSEVERDIDYTAESANVVEQLNKALKSMDFKLGEDGRIEFALEGDQLKINASGAAAQYIIRDNSTALGALGFHSGTLNEADSKDGISFSEFNNSADKTAFKDSSVSSQNIIQYLTGKTLSVTYGGQTKQIDLLRNGDEVNSFAGGMTENADGTFSYNSDSLAGIIQSRMEKAFGSGKVIVDASGGHISFKTINSGGKSQSLIITSNDAELRKTIGIAQNASNHLSMDANLWDNREKLGFTGYGNTEAEKARFEEALKNFKINGTTIDGLTADMSVNRMMEKINSHKDAGVKVSYLNSENQFVLVAGESGSGRMIQLSGAAETIFGTTNEDCNRDGKDAIIEVSYGSGVNTVITSASNTFELEGLKITVNNTFGYKLDAGGKPTGQLDSSQSVSFSAGSDVDGVTEQVKKFFEAYNELATEINDQITARPNKKFDPLTDAQKAEMTEKSIENWETKAKQGTLYNDSTMRELSMSMQGIMTSLLNNGVNSQDLEKIGISMEDGWMKGGTIAFDESKFKAAMRNDPAKAADIFTGGGTVKKGLSQIIEDTFTPYATKYAGRNGNSYGRLIEEAGSPKVPGSVSNNQIYRQLQDMQKTIDKLNSQLQGEQDRYISKFSHMETLISKMNAQSSYLSSMQG